MMRLLDRYILKEFIGPFLFGMGSFAVMVTGAVVAPILLDLMIRKGFPPGLVMQILLCRLPEVIIFALPMAMIFASVMAIADMQTTGELIAVRAGGASLWRLAAPILITGFLISVGNVVLHEVVEPAALDRAWSLELAQIRKMKPLENLKWEYPSGKPSVWVMAQKLDPRRRVLTGLLIVQQHGQEWETFTAREAEWAGTEWVLHDVKVTRVDAQGNQHIAHADVRSHDLGRDPEDLDDRPVKMDEMSVAQLRKELDRRIRVDGAAANKLQVIQYMNTRQARPWVPFFFALVGIPLGMRPTRASTGIGLGLSLVVALVFYVLFHSMHLVGQTGAVPCTVAAWLPNGILLGTGLVLFANAGK